MAITTLSRVDGECQPTRNGGDGLRVLCAGYRAHQSRHVIREGRAYCADCSPLPVEGGGSAPRCRAGNGGGTRSATDPRPVPSVPSRGALGGSPRPLPAPRKSGFIGRTWKAQERAARPTSRDLNLPHPATEEFARG